MKAIELFAGIGGFRIASENLGIKTIWANDIKKEAIKVYKDNFGNIIEGDIKKLKNEVPKHDILLGGFPCQPFSSAGKKKGIKDVRGTLFKDVVDILKDKEPKYFVLENVNRLLTMNKGKDFKTILYYLMKLGYFIEWRVINSIDFSLAQNRKRLIITGTKMKKGYRMKLATKFDNSLSIKKEDWKNFRDNKRIHNWGILFKNKIVTKKVNDRLFPNKRVIPIKEIMQNYVAPVFYFTEKTKKRIKTSVRVDKFVDGVEILYNQKGGARMGYTIFGINGVAPTLTASSSRHYERYYIDTEDEYRRLTNIEYARIQGFPDHHCQLASVTNQYKLLGNAVPPQMIEWVLRQLIF